MISKRYLIVIYIFFLSGCSGLGFVCFSGENCKVAGQSIASEKIQISLLKMVYPGLRANIEFENLHCPNYNNYYVIDSKPLPKKKVYDGIKWREIWHVKACDTVWEVPVDIIKFSENQWQIGTSEFNLIEK